MEPIRRPSQPPQRRAVLIGDTNLPQRGGTGRPDNTLRPGLDAAPPEVTAMPSEANPAPVVVEAMPDSQPFQEQPPQDAETQLADTPATSVPALPSPADRPYAQPAPKRRLPLVALAAILIGLALAGLTLYAYFKMDNQPTSSVQTPAMVTPPVTQKDINDAISATANDSQQSQAEFDASGLSDSNLGL